MAKRPRMGERACPRCKEVIRVDALVCKHCGTEFSAEDVTAATQKAARTKKLTAIGCLSPLLLVVTCAVVVGVSGGEPEAANTAAPAIEAAAPPPALSEDQQAVEKFIDWVGMNVRSCSFEVQQMQQKDADVASGKAQLIDVYEAARRGVQSCENAAEYLDVKTLVDSLPSSQRSDAKSAVGYCRAAVDKWRSALLKAQDIVDHDSSMVALSAFRDTKRAAEGDAATCSMGLVDIGKAMELPTAEHRRKLY